MVQRLRLNIYYGLDSSTKNPTHAKGHRVIMRQVRRAIDKDGSGEVGLIPEEAEDMWHAYNLIAEGDCLRATTIRYVGP